MSNLWVESKRYLLRCHNFWTKKMSRIESEFVCRVCRWHRSTDDMSIYLRPVTVLALRTSWALVPVILWLILVFLELTYQFTVEPLHLICATVLSWSVYGYSESIHRFFHPNTFQRNPSETTPLVQKIDMSECQEVFHSNVEKQFCHLIAQHGWYWKSSKAFRFIRIAALQQEWGDWFHALHAPPEPQAGFRGRLWLPMGQRAI